MKPHIKFGTDGWRGIIADDFTVANVRLVTRAIGNYLRRSGAPGKGILIGFDCRSQSELFASSCADVLASMGYEVCVCDRPTSTPAVAAVEVKRRNQAAIIFTASHNPGTFHGIKFKPHYGGSALTEITNEIERELPALLNDYEASCSRPDNPPAWSSEDVTPQYLADMGSLLDVQAVRQKNYRIVYDAMHGAGAGYLQSVLGEAIPVRQQRNPLFGGVNPEPIPQNIEPTFEAVREYRADVAIIVDGDADRIGAIDEKGMFMDSHRIFAVVLKHLVERKGWKGSVVKTVSTTRMIDKLADHFGLKLHVTPIGFKHICKIMMEEDVLIGGEESGGIGVPRHMLERDGVFIGLLLLEAMALSGKKASELVQEVFDLVGEHHFVRQDLHFTRDAMPAVIAALGHIHPDHVASSLVESIDTLDGLKFLFNDGWLLLRASGTEPVVRVYAESMNPKLPEGWIAAGRKLIEQAVATPA